MDSVKEMSSEAKALELAKETLEESANKGYEVMWNGEIR